MNRARTFVVLGCVAVIAACRGIIGIETLELVDGGTDGAVDAPFDTTSDTSPANDAGLDATSFDAGRFASCAAMGSACLGCCRQNSIAQSGFQALEQYAKSSGCVCAGGSCITQCEASLCANPPGPAVMACGACIDPLVHTTQAGPCQAAGDNCERDQSCAAAIECLRVCP